MNRRALFIRGLRDGLPIGLGYFAVSFAFGIQAVAAGLTPFEAGLLSLTNLTSAGQLGGLDVIRTGGSYLNMAAMQLIINLRYLLMSSALSQKLDPKTSTGKRAAIAYGVTDEIFAVSIMTQGRLEPGYSSGVIPTATLGWVAGTVLGAVAGSILPQLLINALGLALYAMFIAVIVPPARKVRPVTAAVMMAMALSAVFYWLPAMRALPGGMPIIIVTVAVSALCAVVWPHDEANGGGEE